jgi:general secretion pathway protein L
MLIVLLPDDFQDDSLVTTSLHWWRLERDGSPLEHGQDNLQTLKHRFAGQRLRALAPATSVSLYRLSMPVRGAASVRAALPFALEEQLSQDLELLHCVPGPRRSDGRLAAAVVEMTSMERWLALFAACQWRLEALIPLPALHAGETPDQGILIRHSPWSSKISQALVTARDEEPVLIETGMLGLWLRRRLGTLPEDDRIIQASGFTRDELGLEADSAVDFTQVPSTVDLRGALSYCLQPNPPLNLLAGVFATSIAAPPWRKMRPPLIASGVLVAVLLAQFSLEWLVLARERDRLVANIETIFNNSLPNSRMVQPVTQFRQVLEGSAAGSVSQSGGALLYEALGVIAQTDSASIKQFRATPTEMEIELQLASFAELEILRAGLADKPQLQETLQGADSGTDGVTARLKISRRES